MRQKNRVRTRRWRALGAAATATAGLAGLAGLALAAVPPAQAAPRAAALPGGTALAAGTAARPWLPSTPANWPLVVSQTRTPATTITAGVTEYSQVIDTVQGAQHAQVLNVDLASPNVAVKAVEAGNEVIDPADETVKSMGTRTGAVAGINGGYFDINATGQPDGGAVVDGQVLKSPPQNYNAELSVLGNGTLSIGPENFSGTITDGTATEPLTSVNIPSDAAAGDVTEVTPALASASQALSKAATVVTGTATGTPGGAQALTVTGVSTGVTTLAIPPAGSIDLVGSGAGGTWLSSNVKAGDTVSIAAGFGAGNDVTQLISGATVLIKDGAAYDDPTGQPPSGTNPETAVGISKDGKHAIFVTLDGDLGESVAVGVTPDQVTGYLLAHGAYSAILLDGGGSTEIDARLPGTPGLSVLNTPADGAERPVANGLFVYTTQSSPQPALRAVVNDGKPFTVLPGTTEQAGAYALDAEDNPAAQTPVLSVEPSTLATVSGVTGGSATVTAGSSAGSGWLIVRAGHATSRVPLTVAAEPATLAVSPDEPDLANGATEQFTVTGTARTGSGTGPLALGDNDVTWSVSPSSLGTITGSGLFTAAASGSGLATVTATADGVSATASVAVGSAATVVDPMTDVGNWTLNTTNGATATLSESASQIAQPGDTGSMDVHYTIPAASGVSQVVFYPAGSYNVTIGENSDGEEPTGIGLWVKGIGGTAGTPLAKGELTLAEGWIQVNGESDVFYPTGVTYNGWEQIVVDLPSNTEFPLTLNFLDFLVIDPSTTTTGDLYVADLEGLYSPRQPAPYVYTAEPRNPPWLRYDENPADFAGGGVTVAAFGDSHLSSTDEGSTGAVVTGDIAAGLKALPANASPNDVQVDGNLVDPGTLADLEFGKQVLGSFGIPYHTAVGDSDIGQGANPENGNWASVFGPTHYSYTDGQANIVVTDSSWEGLTASDPYQSPDQEQYAWLVSTLDANTSRDVIVVTHASPYDPQAVQNSQFADRWEAQMYEQLLSEYQASHPWTHVLLLNGQARGYYETVINPLGETDPEGLPNFDVSDAGVTPYAPTDEGGFYNYVLFHIQPDGTIQFAVQPVLSAITVTAPSAILAAGTSEQLSAAGTTPTGDNNLPALQVPIADPASHVWSSSDPRVAAVNPRTGEVYARGAGTATITVESGGVTGTTTVTVTS